MKLFCAFVSSAFNYSETDVCEDDIIGLFYENYDFGFNITPITPRLIL